MTMKVALIGGAKGIGGIAGFGLRCAIEPVKPRLTTLPLLSSGQAARPRRSAVTYQTPSRPVMVALVEKQGHIDALINGAGPYHRVNLFEETVTGWNEMFDATCTPSLSRAGNKWE